jgi:signal peptidase I
METPQISDGAKLSLAAEALRAFGELRFVARGSSMLPAIFPGDILIVRREAAAGVRLGDVVLSYRERRFCAHRVVRTWNPDARFGFITQGDALTETDPPIGEDELLGRVTAVLRMGKRIELDERKGKWNVAMRWALRHSNSTVKWLLRWHGLRTRFARRAGEARAKIEPNCVEAI